MTLPDILVPTYVQMLGALSAWLAKAEAQMPDGRAETLLVARLAPDMFPLATQIRFACVDGPEFDAHAVDFAELADRLGAYREHERRATERRRATPAGRARAPPTAARCAG